VLFMIVERFKNQDASAADRHLQDNGRGLPDGLKYVDSWIEPNFDRCFQLMECDDLRLIQQRVLHWREFATFEIVPVVPSSETRELVAPHLD
jgi:hypothetical protein